MGGKPGNLTRVFRQYERRWRAYYEARYQRALALEGRHVMGGAAPRMDNRLTEAQEDAEREAFFDRREAVKEQLVKAGMLDYVRDYSHSTTDTLDFVLGGPPDPPQHATHRRYEYHWRPVWRLRKAPHYGFRGRGTKAEMQSHRESQESYRRAEARLRFALNGERRKTGRLDRKLERSWGIDAMTKRTKKEFEDSLTPAEMYDWE